MQRFIALAVCVLMLGAAGSAVAATPSGKGAVQRSWVSEKAGGKAKASVGPKTTRLYANFVWKTAPQPGRPLRIEWKDPSGQVRAVWKTTTLRSDVKGGRIYAWIGGGALQEAGGTWRAALVVDGVTRGTRSFRVVAPAPVEDTQPSDSDPEAN